MNPVNQNDYLSQYFYEVYNEDIFKRYISFLIYRKKKILLLNNFLKMKNLLIKSPPRINPLKMIVYRVWGRGEIF